MARRSRKPSAPTRGRTVARRRPVAKTKRWSQRVTRNSNALDLEPSVFTLSSPKAVAASLKRSAMRSRRRKAEPYRSAASMLTFYINRAGRTLSASRRRVLERAKGELRRAFGLADARRATTASTKKSGRARPASPVSRRKRPHA